MLFILFAIGAIAMRGAGCTFNDIVDRKYDAAVARIRSRPLPSGQISLRAAIIFLGLQCLTGLLVLLQFNVFTILLSISSLGLVAIYPFMKRITYWPQAVLGLTFNWGALVGWSAITGSLSRVRDLRHTACPCRRTGGRTGDPVTGYRRLGNDNLSARQRRLRGLYAEPSLPLLPDGEIASRPCLRRQSSHVQCEDR